MKEYVIQYWYQYITHHPSDTNVTLAVPYYYIIFDVNIDVLGWASSILTSSIWFPHQIAFINNNAVQLVQQQQPYCQTECPKTRLFRIKRVLEKSTFLTALLAI